MDLRVKAESLPERCEICHQSDLFDPQTNYCHRCSPAKANLQAQAEKRLAMDSRPTRSPFLNKVGAACSVAWLSIVLVAKLLAGVLWFLGLFLGGLVLFVAEVILFLVLWILGIVLIVTLHLLPIPGAKGKQWKASTIKFIFNFMDKNGDKIFEFGPWSKKAKENNPPRDR